MSCWGVKRFQAGLIGVRSASAGNASIAITARKKAVFLILDGITLSWRGRNGAELRGLVGASIKVDGFSRRTVASFRNAHFGVLSGGIGDFEIGQKPISIPSCQIGRRFEVG